MTQSQKDLKHETEEALKVLRSMETEKQLHENRTYENRGRRKDFHRR